MQRQLKNVIIVKENLIFLFFKKKIDLKKTQFKIKQTLVFSFVFPILRYLGVLILYARYNKSNIIDSMSV